MAINNTVTLIGNMGSDADIIDTDNTTFAAVSINVLTFNPKLIEVLKNLKKGSRLEIIGSLSYRPYKVMIDDKEITKYEASIIARKIEQAPLSKKKV